MSQLLIITILVQVNSSPTTEQRQSTINRAKLSIRIELLLSLFLSPTENGTQQCQELNALRITTKFTLRKLTDFSNVLGYNGRTVPRDEDGLGMLCGKRLSSLGCSGLQNHGRALWTGLGEMGSWHVEVLALVVDLTDACGIRVNATLAIENDCILPPG